MEEKYKEALRAVENILNHMEMDIKRVKLTINQISNGTLPNETVKAQNIVSSTPEEDDENTKVVEGFFDGYFMIGDDQKKYPVPMNYSSKTKLIPGDRLKLKIHEDGRLIYKLIAPAERKNIRATLSITDDNKFIALGEGGQTYFLNQAAVTFFKGKPGDELYIITSTDGKGAFAAIEAIIQK